MISTRHFAVLRHAVGLANHVNKIVNVNYASNYCKIDESIFGLSNEQREVSRDLLCLHRVLCHFIAMRSLNEFIYLYNMRVCVYIKNAIKMSYYSLCNLSVSISQSTC